MAWACVHGPDEGRQTNKSVHQSNPNREKIKRTIEDGWTVLKSIYDDQCVKTAGRQRMILNDIAIQTDSSGGTYNGGINWTMIT